MTPDKLDNFTRAYAECALWSSHDESREDGGDPMDQNYDADDIDPDSLARMIEDCADFQDCDDWRRALEIGAWDESQGGHDFWLTRNGHGAGFWDRYFDGSEADTLGDKLSERARLSGGRMLYVGDDGKVYECHA